MNKEEYKIQFEMVLRLLFVVAFATLYALGGIEFKFIRRFIAPLVLTSGMFLFTRNWRVFLQAPLLMFAFSLGYGGTDNMVIKFLKRLVIGLLYGATPIVHVIWSKDKKMWFAFSLNVALCALVMVVLGIFNPFHARAEELLIGTVIGFLSMFMANKKESSNG